MRFWQPKDQYRALPLLLLPVVWSKEQHYTLQQEFQPDWRAVVRNENNDTQAVGLDKGLSICYSILIIS